MLILVSVMAILILGLGCYTNIYGMLHPQIIIDGANVSTTEKVQAYVGFTTVFYLLPITFSILAFWLYDKSVKYINIKNNK